jgi:FkbM family methyltransferase
MRKPFQKLAWRFGRKLYCYARGEQKHDSILRNGESNLQKLVLDHVACDGPVTIFDIGANQAEWSVALLAGARTDMRTPDRLRIEAFEPVPSTAALFRTRIGKMHGKECVKLNEFALSSKPGQAEIAVYADGAGTNSLHFVQDDRACETRIEITLRTMTEYCDTNDIAHIHLAKCDTEGHDLSVLTGARALLEQGRIDIFQFEYNHRWVFSRSFLKDVFDLIEGLNYSIVRVDPGIFPVFDKWHPELDRFFQSNYALVHDRARRWLPLRQGAFDASNVFG